LAAFDQPASSSDGGALLLKLADDRLRLTAALGGALPDAREAGKVGHSLLGVVQQRAFGIGNGYEDANRQGGLDEMIVSLYAGGMTIRDIQHHLASTIGTELSHETISKITDEILDEVLAWQTRPLELHRVLPSRPAAQQHRPAHAGASLRTR